jgi:hypothetical protein
MINVNHAPQAAPASLTEQLAAAIDAGLTGRASAPRRYVGASSVGGDCARRVQLDYVRANELPGAPQPLPSIDARAQRIFDMGHQFEELALRWLKEAGFAVKTRGADGGQIGFSVADSRFSGHCDGVILDGPAGLACPCVWEHKALNNKSWQGLVKHGLKKDKPLYYGQLMLYMAYLDLPNPALFMALNKDTAEIYLEPVPFDGGEAQRLSDRAAQILSATEAGELLPKPFADGDAFACKWCPWRNFCWSE